MLSLFDDSERVMEYAILSRLGRYCRQLDCSFCYCEWWRLYGTIECFAEVECYSLIVALLCTVHSRIELYQTSEW